jgi:pyruvyltransferase
LGDLSDRIKDEGVHLHYWKYDPEKGKHNLGDNLSMIIVEKMKERNGIKEEKINGCRHLYAIGSILQAGYQNATVWGSGFIEDPTSSGISKLFHGAYARKLDIRAVRGPLTAEALQKLGHDVPDVYGDPAMLMPTIYSPENKEKSMEYAVVSHYADKADYDNRIPIMTTDYQDFIGKLCHAKRIISSSLHGVILAEAYGVPAVLFRPEGADEQIPLYKYRDYYYGTGRMEFPVAYSIKEALEIVPPMIPDLSQQTAKLAEAFPKDIWNA